jgi:hypothetical protein
MPDSVLVSALKKTASHRSTTSRAGAAKKFFSAKAPESSGGKKLSRKVSKRNEERDRVPDDQARLFAEVMRATARSLAA